MLYTEDDSAFIIIADKWLKTADLFVKTADKIQKLPISPRKPLICCHFLQKNKRRMKVL
jgi:hypothetical protein